MIYTYYLRTLMNKSGHRRYSNMDVPDLSRVTIFIYVVRRGPQAIRATVQRTHFDNIETISQTS
jgi:hypothetical protein